MTLSVVVDHAVTAGKNALRYGGAVALHALARTEAEARAGLIRRARKAGVPSPEEARRLRKSIRQLTRDADALGA